MRSSEMGLKSGSGVRVGQRFVMVARPLAWYAGKQGDVAVIQQASEDSVYVLFDSGMRESFPPTRFAEYFRPADPKPAEVQPIAAVAGPWIERTPSGGGLPSAAPPAAGQRRGRRLSKRQRRDGAGSFRRQRHAGRRTAVGAQVVAQQIAGVHAVQLGLQRQAELLRITLAVRARHRASLQRPIDVDVAVGQDLRARVDGRDDDQVASVGVNDLARAHRLADDQRWALRRWRGHFGGCGARVFAGDLDRRRGGTGARARLGQAGAPLLDARRVRAALTLDTRDQVPVDRHGVGQPALARRQLGHRFGGEHGVQHEGSSIVRRRGQPSNYVRALGPARRARSIAVISSLAPYGLARKPWNSPRGRRRSTATSRYPDEMTPGTRA